MTAHRKNLIGWIVIGLCGAAGFGMNSLRLQYQNFNLYVALCVAAAVLLVFVARWLRAPSKADGDSRRPTSNRKEKTRRTTP